MTVATAPAPAPPREAEAPARDSRTLRLAAFAALGLFGALHWITLVVDPPKGKAVLCVAVATAGGAALAALPRLRLGRAPTAVLAAAAALATLALALLAVGLPARLLVPTHLGELTDGIDRGLVGISHVSWPYDGPDPWVRLTLLLGIPVALAPAAALAFWPARRGAGVRRGLALVLLLAVYGFAATEHPLGSQMGKGFVLLVLVAAWLWLPRLSTRELPTAAAVVAAVGLVAIPLAGRLDADQPWWDYTSWTPFGGGKNISFDWTHGYGPLDWPRRGTTLLDVRSKQPYYWKAETLDTFDGFRWLHSGRNDQVSPLSEIPGRATNPQRWDYYWFNPRWDARIRVTVRALRSDFLVGAGTTYGASGAGSISPGGDGTTRRTARPLEQGDSYTVKAYVPEPTAGQMRGAPRAYPDGAAQYTEVLLPRRGESALGGNVPGDASRSAEPPPRPVRVPFRGAVGGSGAAARRILASPYAGVYRLARRLTAGAPTEYDAVQRIERHLRSGTYTYDEKVRNHPYPLASFVLRDRRGYCQHFSGAMALMLRMVGIPARVAAGFAPGSHNAYTGEWRVRDLDAHSWVEAYFPGIGWVTFDPTPSAAPAQRPVDAGSSESTNGPAGSITSHDRPLPLGGAATPRRRPSAHDAGMSFWGIAGIVALVLVAAGALAGLVVRRRRRFAPSERVADALLGEIEPALRRLGWQVPGGTTLLALERRLGRALGPGPAGYLARLRAHRYSGDGAKLPGGRERRAFRRALTARRGLRARLLALVSIPPGGPRLR